MLKVHLHRDLPPILLEMTLLYFIMNSTVAGIQDASKEDVKKLLNQI